MEGYKKHLTDTAISAFISGCILSIGITVYVLISQTNKLAGSLLFTFGLYCIIHFKTFLFTGKVGYIFRNKPKYLIELVIGFVCNLLGVACCCYLIKLTHLNDTLQTLATPISNTKLSQSVLSCFILAIFCGIMIYVPCFIQTLDKPELVKTSLCFMGISVFILCGFEHCIANIGYFIYANEVTLKMFGYILITALGNTVGSVLIDRGLYYLDKNRK